MNRKILLSFSGILFYLGITASSMASTVWGYYHPAWGADGFMSGPIFTIPLINPDGDLNKSFLLDSYGNISKLPRVGWEDYYLNAMSVDSTNGLYIFKDAKGNQTLNTISESVPIFTNGSDVLIIHPNGVAYGSNSTLNINKNYSIPQRSPGFDNYKIVKSDDENAIIRYYTEKTDSNGVTIRFDAYGKVVGVQIGALKDTFFTNAHAADEFGDVYYITDESGNNITSLDGETYQNKEGLKIIVYYKYVYVTQPKNYFFSLTPTESVNEITEKKYLGQDVTDLSSLHTKTGVVESQVMSFTKESNSPEARFFIDPNKTTKLDTDYCKDHGFSVFDENLFLLLSESFYSKSDFSATYLIPSANDYLPCVLQRITINKVIK